MEYPCKYGKPSFKEKNDVGPVSGGKKKNAPLTKSLFGEDALGSEINATKKYAKKGKGGRVSLTSGVAKPKPNVISPTSDY